MGLTLLGSLIRYSVVICSSIVSANSAYPLVGSDTNTCVTVRSDELLKVRLNGQAHLLPPKVPNILFYSFL